MSVAKTAACGCMITMLMVVSAGCVAGASEGTATVEERLSGIEKSLAEINVRLGREKQKATPFYNFERRIEDLEKQVDRINDSLRKLEQRVEKLERKKS